MELRQRRYFLAVAEESTFTRAAARLHTDQSALSRQIRRLEDALGVSLSSRTSRYVALTAAGKHLLDRARTLLAELDDALAEVRRAAAAGPLRLRLGWLVPLRGQLLARLVRAFEAASGATVKRVHHDVTDPSAGLSTGAVDAAVINPPIATPALSFGPLLRELRVLISADSK